MPVLVLDTATESALAGVADGGRMLAERVEVDARNAAHRILLAVQDVLEEARVARSDLDGVIVGVGPGSFTGLRIGLATALGLAHGLGIRATGVSSLAALGAAAPQAVAAIDARRGELYVEGPPGEATRAVPAGELARTLAPGVLVVGDGALRHRELLEASGLRVPPEGDPRHRPRTSSYIALARFDGAPVEPLYVRAPDAVPTLAAPPGAAA